MRIRFKGARWSQDKDGFWLQLCVDLPAQARQFVATMRERPYTADLKEYRPHRSLDANAYAWVLMEQIAQATGSSKDEVYLLMLERYGVFTHLVVKPAVVARVKEQWRTVRELGEVTVNGKSGIQLQCYFGSSSYDSKEMSRLIDGIVWECKQLDIETMTPQELSLLKEDWDAKEDKGA